MHLRSIVGSFKILFWEIYQIMFIVKNCGKNLFLKVWNKSVTIIIEIKLMGLLFNKRRMWQLKEQLEKQDLCGFKTEVLLLC